jgi:hypothetical protein
MTKAIYDRNVKMKNENENENEKIIGKTSLELELLVMT